MYWEADNEELFRAVLDAEVVPPEIQATPVRVQRMDGALAFAPSTELSEQLCWNLEDAGLRRNESSLLQGEEVSSWPEAIAARRAAEPEPPLGDVIFLRDGSSKNGSGSLALSGELLRLGCDRQELLFYKERGRRGGGASVLCRVAEPPYYLVLRAQEPSSGLRAFGPERPGSRVFVELGYRHPLAGRLEPSVGEMLLIPGSGPWRRVPDGPWVDLLDCAEVVLPENQALKVTEAQERLRVELRLARAPRRESPSLWILRDNSTEQLESLIRTLPDAILGQLLFAATEGENPTIVLRARSGEERPPALEVEGLACVPLLKIPNLYVPSGLTVTPPLRQARVRELLAPDPDEIVWATPIQGDSASESSTSESSGAVPFQLERLQADDFAPLDEWVDYVTARNADVLDTWVRAVVFDMDSFVSIGAEWAERPAKPKDEPREKAPKAEQEEVPEPDDEEILAEPEAGTVKRRKKRKTFELPTLKTEPSEAEAEAARLEGEICDGAHAMNDPEQLQLWVELANVQGVMDRPDQAALSYTHALWETDGETATAIAVRWAEQEARGLGIKPPTPTNAGRQIYSNLEPTNPAPDELRALAAQVLAATSVGSSEANTTAANPDEILSLQTVFSEHEETLPLRVRWLLRRALSETTGDRLAMLRTRDAILDEMRAGMPVARNVPNFIRLRGARSTDGGDTGLFSLHQALADLLERYRKTKRKLSMIEKNSDGRTDAYVLLLFAWGEARLGQGPEAQGLVQAAREQVSENGEIVDEVHAWCLDAYDARIQQALGGMAANAPLPPELMSRRDDLGRMSRYKVDRLRQGSRILEPSVGLDPFRDFHRPERSAAFAGFASLPDDELAERLDEILDRVEKNEPQEDGVREEQLGNVLDLLDLLPEALAVPRLSRIAGLLSEGPGTASPTLIEKALELSDFLLRPNLVHQISDALRATTQALAGERPAELAALFSRTGPILRRAGLGNRLAELVNELAGGLGHSSDSDVAVSRLQVETARSALELEHDVSGAFEAAYAFVDELETDSDRLKLIRELGIALSHTSPSQAQAGVDQLFKRLAKISDSFNTNSHFSVSVVSFMDSLILALASEDLCLNTWARHWIEDDEHRLRRRIHRDLSAGRSA